jgi:hypothetical protein
LLRRRTQDESIVTRIEKALKPLIYKGFRALRDNPRLAGRVGT